MKNLKKILVSLVLALGLASCSASKTVKTGESFEEILKKVKAKNESVESISYSMDMIMNMAVENQELNTTTHVDAEALTKPEKIKMTLSTDTGKSGTFSSDMYISKEDSNYVMYMSISDPASNTTQWMKQVMPNMDAVQQYSLSESTKLYLDYATSFKETGKETINEIETTKYEGVITGDALKEVLNSPQMSSYTQGLDETGLSFDKMEDVPVVIWIDLANYDLIKMDIDMSNTMKSLIEQALKSQDDSQNINVQINQMLISVTVNGYNNVQDFEIPQEAIDTAMEIPQ